MLMSEEQMYIISKIRLMTDSSLTSLIECFFLLL